MRQIILLIAVVVCRSAFAAPKPANTFTNTLGMVFKPVQGTKVSFCIWETRVQDYATYAAANAGLDASWTKLVFGKFKQPDTHPVVNVSWNEAQAFSVWLTKKEFAAGKIKAGQKYRLPTDAEWSVAVGLVKEKGKTPEGKDLGIRGTYPWQSDPPWPPPKGAGNYGQSLKVDAFEYTSPTGSFAPNRLGLHDMSGNVLEWCEDLAKVMEKESRVLRGASWGNVIPDNLSSSVRYFLALDYRGISVGFRCVLAGE